MTRLVIADNFEEKKTTILLTESSDSYEVLLNLLEQRHL